MPLRTTRTAKVSTRIPAHIRTPSIIAALHTHSTLLRASPYAHAHAAAASPPALRAHTHALDRADPDPAAHQDQDGTWTTYLVTEKIPFYGTVRFYISLRNGERGVRQAVLAPQGLVMAIRSCVVGDEDGTRVLEESVVMTGKGVLMGFTLWSWRRAHRHVQREILAGLGRGEGLEGPEGEV